ncbi:unnamed protein product [Cyclocybe aegerita]|uniref:Acyltransferase 3 domain-containing protein n=1 Tax=Cyclocybe aegerita TaxID=1973307 RepID=A0A8S0VS26_CYCAE|nr:unnamed protein product [Cyclocybe aegerita]
MPSHTESSPLLPLPSPVFTPTRVYYLDNLRTVLVALLIVHHAALTSTASASSESGSVERRIEQRILGVFTTTNEAFLWSAFYLVSGCSSSLAHAKASGNTNANENANGNTNSANANPNPNAISNGSTNPTTPNTNTTANPHLTFLKDHPLPHATHALVWSTLGRTALAQVLTSTSAGQAIFGGRKQLEAHLSGPAAYLALLVVLDCVHVCVRALRLGSGSGTPRMWVSLTRVRGWGGFVVALAGVGLVVCTYLNVTEGCTGTFKFPDVLVSALDRPLPDAPLSCIIAYTIGAHWLTIKASLSPTPTPISRLIFPFVLAASYTFLTLLSLLSPSISRYIQPDRAKPPLALPPPSSLTPVPRGRTLPHAGPNAHTLAFILWDVLTSLILPLALLWLFSSSSSASLLRRPWAVRSQGTWKKGYALTYVHMVPVLVVRKVLSGVGMRMGELVRVGVVVAVALVMAWGVVRGVEVVVGRVVRVVGLVRRRWR